MLGIAHAVGQQMCRFGLTTLVPAREIVDIFGLFLAYFRVRDVTFNIARLCLTLCSPWLSYARQAILQRVKCGHGKEADR